MKRARVLGLVALALVLSAFFWWPMLAAFPNTQGGDGPQYFKMLEGARVAITRYHELPLWSPFECGGLPLWDNPQAPVGAPLAWPIFLIGTSATVAMWYVVHNALGFLCMWIFARAELRLSRAATLVASCAWAFNGFHQQHYSGGHFTFVPFLYFPLALLLWRRAETDVRMAVGLGVLVAWMFYEGGVYPLPHLALLLSAETLMRAWPPQRLRGILRAAGIVGLLGFTLAAARILPVADQLKSHTRALGTELDNLQWATLRDMFLARTHSRGVEGQQYVWPEFGAYVGPILLTLAVLGLFSAGLENLWVVALLAFSFALMLGHMGKYAPWSILKAHVFPFKEMRVPSRFRCEVTMFMAMLMGLAIDRGPRLLRRYLGPRSWIGALRAAAVALALIGVGEMFGVAHAWFDTCFTGAPSFPYPPSARLYFGGPGLAPMIDEPRQNRGRIQCWDEWGFYAGAPLWEGDVPQARAAPGADATVEVANRTQNSFTLDVDVRKPSRILLNSTFDYGWRSSVGTPVEDSKELAVDLPPGHHHVVVRYWPRRLTLGIVINVLGILGLAAWLVQRRRSRLAART